MTKHKSEFESVVLMALLGLMPMPFQWMRRVRRLVMFGLIARAWVKESPHETATEIDVDTEEEPEKETRSKSTREKVPIHS